MATDRKLNRLERAIVSSSCGALLTSFLMTPLDVVKIRLQSQTRMMHKGDCFVYRNGLMDHLCTCFNGPESWYNRKIPGGRYTGTFDALFKIARAEGPSSLWSGLPPTLIMALPSVIIYFTAYDEIKKTLGYHELHNPNTAIPMVSGACARLLAVTAISPIELIRTKVQSENMKYNNVFKFIRDAVKEKGFKTLYRGWVPTIMRDVPFSMIYWLNYETAKTLILKHQQKRTMDNYMTFICGATAGTIAAAITCPFDVVKTHRQVQLGEQQMVNNKGAVLTKDVIKEIYRTKGIQGLFAGVMPRIAKVSMSCAIMITTFEYFKKLFDEDQSE